MSQTKLTQNLQAKGVLKTQRLIQAFSKIDRKDFVPAHLAHLAYKDEALPIGYGQTISQPYTVAFMLELLQPQEGNMILDIGSGSGWQTALLVEAIGEKGKVYALEIVPELCEVSKTGLGKYSFLQSGRVVLAGADATSNLPRVPGGFDRIIAAASGKEVPKIWLDALKTGGRLVLPIENSIWLYIKVDTNTFEKKEYPGFVFVPLVYRNFSPALPGKRGSIPGKEKAAGKPNPRRLGKIIVVIFVVLGGYILAPKSVSIEEFIIPQGTHAREVAENLWSNNVIRSRIMFLAYLRLQGGELSLRPGAYELNGFYTIPGLVDLFTQSGREERAVVIPEGTTTHAIGNILEGAGITNTDTFRITANKSSAALLTEFRFLIDKPANISLEGYLFPDTYNFLIPSDPDIVISRMLRTFEVRLTEEGIFDELKKQPRSLHEILTLASILEEEAVTKEDRELVAGILLRRLTEGLPLQVDASLMYVTGRGTKLLTADDLNLDSPYNTYRYKGLPPGPISNPGIAAIKAALNPQTSPYLFYLSDDAGNIHYSKTFEEHKLKKQKYVN